MGNAQGVDLASMLCDLSWWEVGLSDTQILEILNMEVDRSLHLLYYFLGECASICPPVWCSPGNEGTHSHISPLPNPRATGTKPGLDRGCQRIFRWLRSYCDAHLGNIGLKQTLRKNSCQDSLTQPYHHSVKDTVSSQYWPVFPRVESLFCGAKFQLSLKDFGGACLCR